MKRLRSGGLALAAVASFLAVGTPYWMTAYERAQLPSSLLGPGLLVVAVSAMLLRIYGTASLWRATWVTGASVALAVGARVFVGVTQDPTSHNLWPLEVVIAAMVGFASALPGAIAGSLIAAVRPRQPDGGES